MELVGADDQLDSLATGGKIADGSGFATAVNGIAELVTDRAQPQRHGRDQGEGNGVLGLVFMDMGDAKAFQV